MRVLYGADTCWADVTSAYSGKRAVFIPVGDTTRSRLFGTDPVPGTVKSVVVEDDLGHRVTFDASTPGCVCMDGGAGASGAGVGAGTGMAGAPRFVHGVPCPVRDAGDVLTTMHSTLDFATLDGKGSMREEYPEQTLIVGFVSPHATVLELGGNAGRSSCVLASLLTDSGRLVVFETSPDTAADLYRNRRVNKFKFHVEVAALSARPLVQKAWYTQVQEEDKPIPPGWTPVATMTLGDTRRRYRHLTFDTLVVDCEGALAQILRDEPTLLHGVHTVVLENDFVVPGDKDFVDAALRAAGLEIVHSQAGGGGLHQSCFYQVWKKE